MHIPDGFLSPPVVAVTDAMGLAGAGIAVKKLKVEVEDIPKLGIWGAFLFAIQVFSFPVPGGTSVHLSGVPLLSIVLGPARTIFLSAVTLLLQALLFGHGGILTWGANFINIGITGAVVTYYLSKVLTKLPLYPRVFLSVLPALPLGGLLAGFELGISKTLPIFHTMAIMLLFHIPVSVLEAILTATVFRFLSHESIH